MQSSKNVVVDVRIHESWKQRLLPCFQEAWFLQLREFVHTEYRQSTVYPPAAKIFRAFDLCPFESVRVVIVGQDPYHGPGQANGLCFSVAPEVQAPPSLQNIFKELERDLGRPPYTDKTLESWARQGVLLLNSSLSVRAGQAASHSGKGWEQLTDAALAALAREREHIVFILWGAYAQKKVSLLDTSKHHLIASPHPSPLSAHRGFFGSAPFSKTNTKLREWGQQEIDW